MHKYNIISLFDVKCEEREKQLLALKLPGYIFGFDQCNVRECSKEKGWRKISGHIRKSFHEGKTAVRKEEATLFYF